MESENDETAAFGATTRINPAGFLAALERTGYRVSAESSFDKPSGAIDAAAGVLGLCGLAEALAGPAWLRRFHSAAVKAFAVAVEKEFVGTTEGKEEAGHGN